MKSIKHNEVSIHRYNYWDVTGFVSAVLGNTKGWVRTAYMEATIP